MIYLHRRALFVRITIFAPAEWHTQSQLYLGRAAD